MKKLLLMAVLVLSSVQAHAATARCKSALLTPHQKVVARFVALGRAPRPRMARQVACRNAMRKCRVTKRRLNQQGRHKNAYCVVRR